MITIASQAGHAREVDHQFILGRRLHRQVSRLLAREDAVDVGGGAPVLIDEIRAAGDEAASGAGRVAPAALLSGARRYSQMKLPLEIVPVTPVISRSRSDPSAKFAPPSTFIAK